MLQEHAWSAWAITRLECVSHNTPRVHAAATPRVRLRVLGRTGVLNTMHSRRVMARTTGVFYVLGHTGIFNTNQEKGPA